MRRAVLLSGHLGAGKTGLARLLRDDFNFHIVRTSDILRGVATERKLPVDRKSDLVPEKRIS